MSILQSVFLGVLQGITEFLPISSSGHLVLVQHLFGLNDPEAMLVFDIALHFGTLLSLLVVYWRDLVGMILLRERRLLILLIVATLPAVVVGLCFKEAIEGLFVSPRVAAFGLLVTGTLLWLTKRYRLPSGKGGASVLSAFLVGSAQAVAITPGISRSGSTMATGLFLKYDPAYAARFSFLMAIPAILGSVVLEAPKLVDHASLPLVPVVIGTIASALTGFLAIKTLLKIMSRGQLYLFAPYCWVMGVVSMILIH